MKHIVACIDQHFVEQLCVHLTSFANHHSNGTFRYHVMFSGLTFEDKHTILAHVPQNIDIQFYSVDYATIKKRFHVSAQTHHRLTLATFFRLMMGQLLPQTITDVLYLDADTLVVGNLSVLFQSLPKGALVGTVIDINIVARAREVLNVQHDYFNAGVMRINLARWRESQVEEKAVAYFAQATNEQLVFNDQDALNAVLCESQITWYQKQWNYQTCQVQQDLINKAVLDNPFIVHFTGIDKPWHLNSSHFYREQYLAYRQQTQFANFKRVLQLDERVVKALEGLTKGSTLIIYGAGEMGMRIARYIRLSDCDLSIWCFWDANCNAQGIDDIPVYNVNIGIENADTVVIASEFCHADMVGRIADGGQICIVNPFE